MRKRCKQRRIRNENGGAALIIRRSIEQRRIESLNRPLTDEEQIALITGARVSAENLRLGVAELADLHNVAAFINVGSMLALDIGEHEAYGAIQAGVFAVCDVKARGGPRYAMNAEQREAVMQAVSLTDDVFRVSTLLEISTAHHKIMKALPMTGELKVMQIAA